MSVLIQEIAGFLYKKGSGEYDEVGTSGNIFLGDLPSSPDKAISLRETGGSQADGKLNVDLRNVQILVRGTRDVLVASEWAQEIYDLLHGFHNDCFMYGGLFIVNCRGIQSGPTHLGRDTNERHEYSLNFELSVCNENRR